MTVFSFVITRAIPFSERKVLTEKTNDASGQDSDSSPLPSLEDEPASGGEKTQRTKKKTVAKKDGNEKVSKGEKVRFEVMFCIRKLGFVKLVLDHPQHSDFVSLSRRRTKQC